MTNNHYQKNHSSGGASKGFYIALGVCLIAIGVAAWTTYDSVINYATPEEEPSSSQTTAYPANEAVSGVLEVPGSIRTAEHIPQQPGAAIQSAGFLGRARRKDHDGSIVFFVSGRWNGCAKI